MVLLLATAVVGCGSTQEAPSPHPATAGSDPIKELVARVAGDHEDLWDRAFRDMGRAAYPQPTIVLYRLVTGSACGLVKDAGPPVYCELDQRVYVETEFLREVPVRGGASADFLRAYLVAHEIGRHVGHVLDPAAGARPDASQADCYAGIWLRSARTRGLVDQGDLERGMPVALAIPLRAAAPDAGERLRAFNRGFDSGDPAACRTPPGPAR